MSAKLYTPPTFGAFAKTNIFQVYDKDTLDHQVRVVSKSTDAVTFDTSVIYAPKQAQPRGVIKVATTKQTTPLKGVTFDATLHTDVSKASSLGARLRNVFPTALPGVNVAVTETTSEKDFGAPKYGLFGTVAVDYTRPNVAATASVTTDGDSNHGVSASASVGFDGFSVGGDVKLTKSGEGSFVPKSYNAGLTYTRDQYTVALTSDAKFDKIKAALLVAKPLGYVKWTQVGLQAKVDLQAPKVGAPQREVIFGGKFQSTPDTAYQGALVLTSGAGVFGVEHRLKDPKVAVSATAQFGKPASLYAPFPVSRFGVAATFGEY